MATKKKVVAKPKAADTAQSLLKYLHEHYDFGRALDNRIAEVVRRGSDPLLNIPDWLRRERNSKGYVLETYDNVTRIAFGMVDEHYVLLTHTRGGVTFAWGCRRLTNEAGARAHWRDDVSRKSGELRPHATKLIDFIAALCRYNGWAW